MDEKAGVYIRLEKNGETYQERKFHSKYVGGRCENDVRRQCGKVCERLCGDVKAGRKDLREKKPNACAGAEVKCEGEKARVKKVVPWPSFRLEKCPVAPRKAGSAEGPLFGTYL